jgi:hypothetical protein
MITATTNSEKTFFQKVLDNASAGIAAVFEDIDGVSKITELACIIFSLHPRMEPFFPIMRYTADITTFGSLLKRVTDWTSRDSNGEMIWQRKWHVIATTFFLTCANIISAINFLFRVSVVHLKMVPAAMIGTAGNACFLAYYAIDCVTQGSILYASSKEITEITQSLLQWENLEKELNEKNLRDFVHARILDMADSPKKVKRIAENTAMQKATPPMLKIYVERRIERCKIKIQNEKERKYKAWVTIAVNVGNVVLFSLGFVVTAFINPAAALVYVITAVGIATFTTDIANSLCDAYLAKHELPPPLPLC